MTAMWDYQSDLDEQPCGGSRERELITVHCLRCGAVEVEWMSVDWDLIGEELPMCLCGGQYEEGDLPFDYEQPGILPPAQSVDGASPPPMCSEGVQS